MKIPVELNIIIKQTALLHILMHFHVFNRTEYDLSRSNLIFQNNITERGHRAEELLSGWEVMGMFSFGERK